VKHLFTIIGTAIAGMFVMSVWGAFSGAYGIGGGWFAGFLIIGSMWYMNHYLGVHNNDGAWVDMALGIGTAGLMRGVFENGISVGVDALPTLLFVAIGGILGGVTAVAFERYKAKAE
jgi:hypothetical protein